MFAGAAFCSVLLGGCVTVTTLRSTAAPAPVASSSVLLMKPDVQLYELTAGGLEEPNAQWTAQGLANIKAAVSRELRERNVSLVPYQAPQNDPERERAHRQLLKLHEAVGATIIAHNYNEALKLPTKGNIFDYSLGRGTSVLRDDFGADYALFTYLHDSYASGGRVAAIMAMAVLGVGLPGGVQRGFASLVDLRTGTVTWFNVLVSGTGDVRTAEPAEAAVASLLAELPL
jgi:hypothetical protein